jgi:anti-sigma B factor antagonist
MSLFPPLPGAYSTGGRLEGLQLSTEQRADSVIVTVRGDLDIVTSGQFDDCLTQARRASSRIILDLAAVDFLDTSCLAVIVGHWKKLVAAGGVLALAGARYRYTKALWITGLADRLPSYETVERAISAGPPLPAALAGERGVDAMGDSPADGALPR